MLSFWVRLFGTFSLIQFDFLLDDRFDHPPGLIKPPASPTRPLDNSTRLVEDEDPLATLPEDEEERGDAEQRRTAHMG